MFTLRGGRAPTTTLSQTQGSRAPGPPLIGYLLGDWQARNDWLRTRGPPSGRSDWLLFNLGRASPTPESRGPPGARPLATLSAPPRARHPFRRILTLRVRPSCRRALRGRGARWRPGRRGGEGEKRDRGGQSEGNKEGEMHKIQPPTRSTQGGVALQPPAPPIPETGGAPCGEDAPSELTPTDRCVPSGSKVSFLRLQPAPASVQRGGKGEIAAPRARVVARLLGNPPPQLSAAAAPAPLFRFPGPPSGRLSPGPARDGPLAAQVASPPTLLPSRRLSLPPPGQAGSLEPLWFWRVRASSRRGV